MPSKLKPKKLEWLLSELRGFETPKIRLEQYETSPQLAVCVMEAIDRLSGLEDKLVADLGCGCGMLIAAIAAGYSPLAVVGIDIDADALKICRENLEEAGIEEKCDLIQANVLDIERIFVDRKFDIVITNPPFGTKQNAGLDMAFVRAGLAILRPGGSLFSLHKTSTRDYILKTARKIDNLQVDCAAELKWNLPATYKFHKRKEVDIQVDLMHFQKL